jgi:hypothetical protein
MVLLVTINLSAIGYGSLFGTAIVQAYVYGSTCVNDRRWIKAVVGTVM